MSTPVFMAITLASSGLLMGLLMLVYHSRLSDGARIHDQQNPLLTGARFYRTAALNSLVSVSMLFAAVLGLGGRLISDRPAAWWVSLLQGAAVLLVYDFFYYLMHRYPFHEWKLLRRVHAVHHTGKYPTAIDSLYIHPLETFLGVALLIVSLWLVGPVSSDAFRGVFVVYTSLNIVNHCALDFRVFPLNILGFLARKHDRHHDSMKVGNYASITPLPDLLFGTLD